VKAVICRPSCAKIDLRSGSVRVRGASDEVYSQRRAETPKRERESPTAPEEELQPSSPQQCPEEEHANSTHCVKRSVPCIAEPISFGKVV
jgi:hypothetical protein